MAMRLVISRSRVFCGNWKSSGSSVCCFSNEKGRVFEEEEQAKEAIYIKKMEKEKMDKLKNKSEHEKVEGEKSDKVGGSGKS